MELSNLYINRNGTLAYMGIISQNIIDGIECSEKDISRIKEVDRLNIFTRDTVFDWCYKFKFATLKNTVK